MPLVDLDDPEELRARWTALAAVAHATGFDRRWYADADGYHHQDESASVLRMVRLGDGRAVLWGFHTQHSRTGGEDLLAGSPEWIGQPEVRQRQDAGELGFVYGAFNGSWARASYPGDPWEPVEDGFAPIGAWITSDEATADVMSEWVAAWCDYLGGLDELRPHGVELIRAAGAGAVSAEALGAYFAQYGIDPRSPVQPDLPAGVVAAEDFTRDYAPNVAEPASFDDEPDTAEVSVVEDPVIGDSPQDEESYVVPPGISPFTGQPIEPAPAPGPYEGAASEGENFFDTLFADAPAAAAPPEDEWETAEQQPWSGPAWINGEWVEDPSTLEREETPFAPGQVITPADPAPADSPFAPGRIITTDSSFTSGQPISTSDGAPPDTPFTPGQLITPPEGPHPNSPFAPGLPGTPVDAVPANSPFARTQPLSPVDPSHRDPQPADGPGSEVAAREDSPFVSREVDDEAPTAEIEAIVDPIASDGVVEAADPVEEYAAAVNEEVDEEEDEPASFTGPSPFAPVVPAEPDPVVPAEPDSFGPDSFGPVVPVEADPGALVGPSGADPVGEEAAAFEADDQTAEIPVVLDDTEPPGEEAPGAPQQAAAPHGTAEPVAHPLQAREALEDLGTSQTTPSPQEWAPETDAPDRGRYDVESAPAGRWVAPDDSRIPVDQDARRHPDDEPALVVPGIGVVAASAPQVEVEPGSLEEAMRAEVERPRPRPPESEAFRKLHAWCRARTKIVPSGFTIQVQVLDPNAPSYRFDLEPPEVDDPEFAADKLSELLADLWLTEAESEQGGWLFARIDAAGRTVRIDRWYDQVPDWWDNPIEERLDVGALVRRLDNRGAQWQPSYLERLYTAAR